MATKTFIPEGEAAPASQIGASLEALAHTIWARRTAGEESYTWRLLNESLDTLLKKIIEESAEVVLAAKETHLLDVYSNNDNEYDASVDHLRYEAADVIYHLMVLLARFEIDIDELAAEINNRMTDEERPYGALRLYDEFVRRGK